MFRFRTAIAILSVLMISFITSYAQDGVQQVTVTYTNEGISVFPAEIPAGLTTFVMDNQSDTHNGGPIGRFKDGMTMDDLVAAAAENRLLAPMVVFDLYGSLSGVPGSDQSITLDLQAGNYAFLGQAGMGTLTVVESDVAAESAPEHDVSVVMVDFAYGTQSVIPAGEQVWRIRNEGEQIHEFLVVPVDDTTSLDEATELFRSMGDIFNVMAGTSPVIPLKIWGPLSPGNVAWIPVTLEPGTYALGTLLPDLTTLNEGDAPLLQIDHGMVRIFTVE